MLQFHDIPCDHEPAGQCALGRTEELGRSPTAGSDFGTARLYTCRVALRRAESVVGIFAAHVASDPEAATAALARRFGSSVAARARIEEGFDRRDPYAAVFVSPAIADELDRVAAAPHSSAHRRYELMVERRFGL